LETAARDYRPAKIVTSESRCSRDLLALWYGSDVQGNKAKFPAFNAYGNFFARIRRAQMDGA
jgi:hypothetical protein